MSPRVVVCGAGGHAAVLIEVLQALTPELVAIVDRDGARRGECVGGVRIVGDDDTLPELARSGVTHFVVGVGGTSDTRARSRVYARARAAGLEPLTVLHPAAWVAPSARLAPGVTVFARAIVGTAACLGEHVLINSGAIVEHDCVIGAHVHVATGACLAGGVHIGDGSHVGLGAVVRERLTVGAHVVIGAGAAVVTSVPDNVMVFGVPARIVGPTPMEW